jgi:hypothetical protein
MSNRLKNVLEEIIRTEKINGNWYHSVLHMKVLAAEGIRHEDAIKNSSPDYKDKYRRSRNTTKKLKIRLKRLKLQLASKMDLIKEIRMLDNKPAEPKVNRKVKLGQHTKAMRARLIDIRDMSNVVRSYRPEEVLKAEQQLGAINVEANRALQIIGEKGELE